MVLKGNSILFLTSWCTFEGYCLIATTVRTDDPSFGYKMCKMLKCYNKIVIAYTCSAEWMNF